MKYNIPEHESIDGLFMLDGAAIACGLHASQITISDSAVAFKYGDAIRSYALTKADGKITSITNPDGAVTEVVRDG